MKNEPDKTQPDLGHIEILARELITQGGERTGMSYLIYLSDPDSEVSSEAWLSLMDDGKVEVEKAKPEGL